MTTREHCQRELERLAKMIDTAIALRELSAGRPTSATWRSREARQWVRKIQEAPLSEGELMLSEMSAMEAVR